MRIVHMTSVHRGFDTRIYHKECAALAAAGHQVSVIAPWEDRKTGSIRIISLKIPASRYERMTRTAWALYRAAVRENADVYHFHDPELIPVGFLLRAQGHRVIYDVHEDMPTNVLSKPWLPRKMRRPIGFAMNVLSRLAGYVCSAIVTATPTNARLFPSSRTIVVRNYPEVVFKDDCDRRPFVERAPIAVYCGSISRDRGIFEMLSALEGEGAAFELLLAGYFQTESLRQEAQQAPGWGGVTFRGSYDQPELSRILQSARVGICLLHPTPQYVNCEPTKVFEYMVAGLPVVTSDFPLLREIVGTAKCGLLVDPADIDAIRNAVTYLATHPDHAEEMGKRGRVAILERLNWSNEAAKLVKLYARLERPSRSRTVRLAS